MPIDSDECLRISPDWDNLRTCKNAIRDYPDSCQTWARDMRRCCPQTCATGQFIEQECKKWTSGDGTCMYPNYAQCHDQGVFLELNYSLRFQHINSSDRF